MTIQILAKGDRLNITAKAQEAGGDGTKFYFGAGWAPTGSDLDLVGVYLKGGKAADIVYYGKKSGPGLQLSDDNRTGAGDGDDEWLKVDTTALPADVDGLLIGLFVYAGDDFATIGDPHIRACAGPDQNAPQIFDFPIKDSAFDGDTVLQFARLKKGGAGWLLEAIGKFQAVGKGQNGLQAFSSADFS